jgi:hypothetical protein
MNRRTYKDSLSNGRTETTMSLPLTTSGQALGPDDGEALWFNSGLGILKATAEQAEGRDDGA